MRGRDSCGPLRGTMYARSGDNVVEELGGGGNLLAHYTQGDGIDEPLAMTGAGGTYFYQADGLASITSLTDGSGQLAASFVYDSFGKLTASTGTVTNPFQYTGREFDTETGLYYYRARHYDSTSGRFLSEDPEAFAAGINFYSYVQNRPIVLTDPLGDFPTSWHRDNTYRIASRVFGPKCQDKAKAVAEANASVDALPTLRDKVLFVLGQGEGWKYGGPHFPVNDVIPDVGLENATRTCSLHDLGTSLHTMQDSFAHFGGAWGPTLHYITGPEMDYAAVLGPVGDQALAETETWVREFKRKCLSCCE